MEKNSININIEDQVLIGTSLNLLILARPLVWIEITLHNKKIEGFYDLIGSIIGIISSEKYVFRLVRKALSGLSRMPVNVTLECTC